MFRSGCIALYSSIEASSRFGIAATAAARCRAGASAVRQHQFRRTAPAPAIADTCIRFARTSKAKAAAGAAASEATSSEGNGNGDSAAVQANVAAAVIEKKSYAKRLSFSRLDTYVSCPRKFYYGYVLDAPDRITNINLLLGRALHAAAAHFADECIKNGKFPPLEDVNIAFIEEWAGGIAEEVDVLSQQEQLDLLRNSARTSLVQSLKDKDKRVLFAVDEVADHEFGADHREIVEDVEVLAGSAAEPAQRNGNGGDSELLLANKERILAEWRNLGLDVVRRYVARQRKALTLVPRGGSAGAGATATDDNADGDPTQPASTVTRQPLMAERAFNISIRRRDDALAELASDEQRAKHETFVFNGFIDRVDRVVQRDDERPGGIADERVVIEYKTQVNRFAKSSLEKHLLQLKTYMLAHRLLFGWAPKQGRVESFMSGEAFKFQVSEEAIDQVENLLHIVATRILHDVEF